MIDRVDVKIVWTCDLFFRGEGGGRWEELHIIEGRAYLGKLLWEYLILLPHIRRWMRNDRR